MLIEQDVDIPKKYREKLDQMLVTDLHLAVDSVEERNDLFFRWDAQLRGDPFWAGIKPRWRGGCDLEDPITREHHLMLVANMMQVLRSDEWWNVNAIVPEDESDAGIMEAWINDLVPEYNLSGSVGYDLCYNAARHSYGVLYCGWRQAYQTNYRTVYVDKVSGETVEPEGRIPGNKYKLSSEVTEELEHEGLEFRVPHASDFGMFPADVQSVKLAHFTWERMEYTASSLLDGVSDEAYDEEAVKKLIKYQGTAGSRETYFDDRNEADGLGNAGSDKLYELYVVIGRPPELYDDNGDSVLKEDQRRRDYMWLVSLDTGIVVKMSPMPYRKRPYALFPFLPEPGRVIGDGVCSLLGPLQREATLATRFSVDVRDVAMSPVMLVPRDDYDDLNRYGNYPGARLPYDPKHGVGGGIVPLTFNTAGFGAALENNQEFRVRAAQLLSAQARGSTNEGGNAKTAHQVSMEAAGADEKFDLILTCFSIGKTQLAEIIISHFQQFGGRDWDPQMAGTKVVQLSPEMLEKKFRVTSNGTSESANPQLQLQKAMELYQMVLGNPIIQQKAAQGDMTAIWTVSTQVARILYRGDPKNIFGPEPQPPPSAEQILQTIAAAIQQFAQMGDPGAGQLLQMLQQLSQSQPGAGAPSGPQGQGGAGSPQIKESLAFKDLAPNQQDAMAQMAGLPPASQNGASRNGVTAH